jgi:tight adherence protein B
LTVLAAFLVGLGAAIIVVIGLEVMNRKGEDLRALLDLPYGEQDVPVQAVTESPRVSRLVSRAGAVFEHLDRRGSVARAMEEAQLPLRAGEYIFLVVAGAVVLSLLLVAVTSSLLLVVPAVFIVVGAALFLPKYRAEQWRRAFQAQLPDALAMIASSLSAGHTFLRAIQNMSEEAEPPLSKEFGRVVSETELGKPVVDALESAARRTEIRDLMWVVQAIRIQQAVGGKLADLLHTLADFMRARQEVRREVDVLTADGRLSAKVLAAMPVVLFLLLEVINPKYVEPMLHGWHVAILVAAGVWMAVGVAVMFRMLRMEV